MASSYVEVSPSSKLGPGSTLMQMAVSSIDEIDLVIYSTIGIQSVTSLRETFRSMTEKVLVCIDASCSAQIKSITKYNAKCTMRLFIDNYDDSSEGFKKYVSKNEHLFDKILFTRSNKNNKECRGCDAPSKE